MYGSISMQQSCAASEACAEPSASSEVAELVAARCRAQSKRVLALGGAKNHLVALPDCDEEVTESVTARIATFQGPVGNRYRKHFNFGCSRFDC